MILWTYFVNLCLVKKDVLKLELLTNVLHLQWTLSISNWEGTNKFGRDR